MDLSKTIIYGSDQEVVSILKTKPEIDVIDEYGYTPLIQTTIVNSLTKAKILLEAGAKVDFQDLTGRTALFWAADNNNLALCELFLKHKANPNAYSSGAQPILVMPLMKEQQDIKNLLLAHGAKLTFAQDFLNAKLLGHGFELEGRVDIVDTRNTFIEVELEGFYLRFTLEVITKSFIDFRNSFGAKKMRPYFSYLDTIIHSLQAALELIRLQHYLIDIKPFLTKINSLLDIEPLILPISFGGHAITLIKLGDLFIRCDRGEYGRNYGSIIYYDMRHPENLTKAFCHDLLYKRQYPEFINNGLMNHLGLKPRTTLGLPVQKTGNCSWANVEAIIPAIMFPLLLKKQSNNNYKEYEAAALDFYHEWREWNKTRSLDLCIQSIRDAETSRKISKASLLASIIFQACDYKNPADRTKSNKILTILAQPDYLSILKCYAKTFSREKDNTLWGNFSSYLEDVGIDVAKLTA